MSAAPAAPATGTTAATTTTIFVRHLPYSWSDADLERAFEHVGPIKRAFCVTARGAKKPHQLGADGAVSNAHTVTAPKVENRGFGFIEFATHSDARRAVDDMNGKAVDDPNADASDATGAKKKGPQKLAVELSVPKGEKPVVLPKKEATAPATAATSAAAAPTPAAPAAKPNVVATTTATVPKKEKLKDVKLDTKALAAAAAPKAAPTVKKEAASDSETSDSEDENAEAAQTEARKEAAKKSLAAVAKSAPAAATAAAKKSTPTPVTATATAASSRTVLLSGINPTVKSLDEHLKGLVTNLEGVLFPSPESTLKYKAARLTFASDVLADAAVKLLDKKLIKGDAVRAIRLQNEVKANRMIIRNLPWTVGEKRIHLIFRDCCKPPEQGGGGGKIVSIDLPKEADGKSKGFGFIAFSTLKAAELALAKTGTILNNRPIAVDWALAKDDYQNRVKQNEVEEKKQAEKAAEKEKEAAAKAKESKKKDSKTKTKTEDDDVKVKVEDAEEQDMLDLGADKRKNKSILSSILGDASDSEEDEEEKKDAKSTKAKQAAKVKSEDDMSDVEDDEDEKDAKEQGGYEDEDESMSGTDNEDDEDGSEEDDDEDDDHDDDDLNVSDDDSQADDNDDDDDADLGDEAAPELDQTTMPKFTHNRPSDTAKGCTVFIRNLAYDTTEEKLLDKFKQFGTVTYGKVVWDKELDRSRGTAFVKFEDPAVAAKVVGLSVDTSTNPGALFRKNKITAAVASGQGITLDGRVLNIALAVDREQATTLAEKNKVRQAADKRNLYLANEGNIRADSEAGRAMPPAELARREAAFREKKKKLKNPNYCVSRTRLSVRQLPLEVDEKVLKRVFLKAARDAIKQQPKDSPLRDGTIGQPTLVQVKLLRANDKFDAKGAGKSKRYGFVEFDRHEHSLLALRALNNNPDAFASAEIKSGKHARPFVEFALEDARKLQIRNAKLAAQARRKEIKAKQQAELDVLEGKSQAEAAKKKSLPKSSEQPRKKPAKPVADPQAGGGRGACFVCGEGGHIGRNCPKAKGNGKAGDANGDVDMAEEKKQPPTTNKPAGGKSAGSKRKAPEVPASSDAASTSTEPRAKKNKNNKHKDVAVPKHLNDDRDEAQFDKLVQQHKKKFFGADADAAQKVKQAASRWFE